MVFGIVVDINDPEKLGRCKVKLYHIHDNIPTDELGWSIVLMPATTPAQNGLGSSVNLQVGTLVTCQPLDSTQQEFIITGTLPTKTDITTPTYNEDGEETESETVNTHDNNPRVRAEANPHADEISGTYEPESSYAPEYPYNNVYETESGHVTEYDDTPGHERITKRHKSGTQYEIGPNGSKIERIVRDNYQVVMGHDTLEVKGNVKIYVSGDANLAVSKNLTAQVGNDMTTIVNGNAYTTVDGNADLLVKGDIDGEVRGNIDIDVGTSDPEHVIYDDDGVAVHHVVLGGYTKNKAIEQWFPPVKTSTFTLTHKNMRKVKELSAEAQAPYASALATFDDYDRDKVKLVDGKWTYPDKTSYTASFGNIELHTEGGLKAIVGGEVDVIAFQNAKLDIRKNADIDVAGNVDMDVVGNIVIDATGDESIIDINTIGDSSQIDINTAGLLKVMSTGTTNIESTADMTLKSTTINLDGNVEVTGNIVTQGTTTTDGDLVLDTHAHTISGGSSAGNTSGPN